jgi:hypothetical protein
VWSPQAVVGAIRDVTLLGVGSFGILFQQIQGTINAPLLILYTAMVGVPGAAGVIKMVARTASEPPSLPPPLPLPPGEPGSSL